MSNCRQPGRDARAQAESQAQAIIAQGRRMARQRLEGAPLEEEPMKRYAHPIPYCIDCPTPPPADGLTDSGRPWPAKISFCGAALGPSTRSPPQPPEYPEPLWSSYRFVKFANFLLSDGFPFLYTSGCLLT